MFKVCRLAEDSGEIFSFVQESASYGISHNKVTVLHPYIRSYSYPFNARTHTRATPVPVPVHVLVYTPVAVPVHVLVYTPVAIAVSYETAGAKRTEFSDCIDCKK